MKKPILLLFLYCFMSCSSPEGDDVVNSSIQKNTTPDVNQIQINFIADESLSNGKMTFSYSFSDETVVDTSNIFIEIKCRTVNSEQQLLIENSSISSLREGAYFVEYIVRANPIRENNLGSHLPITKISRPLRYSDKIVEVRDGFITNIHVVFK